MYERIDIDRLHDVVTRRLAGPGAGKTHAACHELAGIIELGERSIVALISRQQDVEHIILEIKKVFYTHGLDFTRERRDLIIVKHARVWFVAESVFCYTCFEGACVYFTRH